MDKKGSFELTYSSGDLQNVVRRSFDFSKGREDSDEIIDIMNNFYGLLAHSAYDIELCLDVMWEIFFEKELFVIREELDEAYQEKSTENEDVKKEKENQDIYTEMMSSDEHYNSFKKQLEESENLKRLTYRLYAQHMSSK